jgi:Fe-S cluster assembly protein SufD
MSDQIQALLASHGGDESGWLGALRAEARGHFETLGFPTTRAEDWKYTSTRSLREAGLVHDTGVVDVKQVAAAIDGLDLPSGAGRLVLYNGRLVQELSDVEGLPNGVTALPLALATEVPGFREHLGSGLNVSTEPFTALNQAFLQDGLYLSLASGVELAEPLVLVHVARGGDKAVLSNPRNLVVLGDNARGALLEVDLGEGTTCTNTLTEVILGTGAYLEHHRWQLGDAGTHHVGRTEVRQGRDSDYRAHTLSLGKGWVRNDVVVGLDAPGASCNLRGLYLTGAGQHVDNHTTIHHWAAHCTSRELYKGVLSGKSRGVFNGRIVVHRDAQKSDSDQGNHNLLLSEAARVDTKPQLEIFADDVKAAHGTTVGQLDENAVFYMRSRGISKAAAVRILAGAFAREILDDMAASPVYECAMALVDAKLGSLYEEGE